MPRDAVTSSVGGEATRFEVLGPVRVRRGERELDLGFPQQRALLALLLTHAGRTVQTGEILDVLWAERPPASAPNVIRRYVGALRRLLEPGLPPRAPGRRLLRRPGGYLLEAGTDEVDLLRFRALTRQGRRAAATGRPETAARHFTQALGEWRGPLAMGIPAVARAHVRFTAVQRELLDTARLAADAALLCGRAEQVLPALRHAAADEPLDEPLHARLVLVLAACGLQAEALRTYEDIRRRLATDLSLTPGPELSAAHTRVLRQEVRRVGAAGADARIPRKEAWGVPARVRTAAAGRRTGRGKAGGGSGAVGEAAASVPFSPVPADGPETGGSRIGVAACDAVAARPVGGGHVGEISGAGPADGGPGAPGPVVRGRATEVVPRGASGGSGSLKSTVRPAQLPQDPAGFTGREAESARLAALGRASGVVLVGGMPGVGKSALVVHWAHRVAHRFPDGQLYVRLRGFEPGRPAVKPVDALRSMLAALGVPARHMPDGPAALGGLYRTLSAGRRLLVVLDDAVDTEQSRPLLSAAPGCLTVVTSRSALPGLVASGARPLPLEPPSAEDAHAILTLRLGAGRPAAEPAAAEEIVARCGRLPLALTAVAARAAAHPHFPLAAVAAELRASHGSLDALDALRPVFLTSYRRLPDDSAHLFRLLSRHPGPHITPATAASLTGAPVRRIRLLLGRLAESHLLAEPSLGRYTLHDLLRALAAELAETVERSTES
ncbi:BTAD domain-containing putative transcriptional regulator [Streptomyces sp. NPDC049687]|uniref:AfsR/SARP family transcriptional regulator n=1 Tax=Streptomyces sp. NPDC049687 TaxID=3365596 RepID=UPI00379582AA